LAVLTAGVLAVSVMLSSTVPVRAEASDRDLVAALVALGVIGVIVSEANRKKSARKVVQHAPHWHTPIPQHAQPQHPQPQRGRPVPEACAIEIEDRNHRNVVVYTATCLRDYGIARLPDRCARVIRFYGREDRIYSEGCLREAGFRFGDGARSKPERPD